MYWMRYRVIALMAVLFFAANNPALAQEEAVDPPMQPASMQEDMVDPIQMAYEEAVAVHDGGDLELAIKMYKDILKQDKTHAATYANMGLAYMHLDKQNEAIDAYKKAIEYNTEDEDARYNLGTLYYEKGKYDDAIKAFEAVLMQASDVKQVDLYLNLGNAHFEKDHYDQAIEAYQTVTRIDPDLADPYFNMAIVYAKQKDVDGVIANLQMYKDKAADAAEADQVQMWLTQLASANETPDEEN